MCGQEFLRRPAAGGCHEFHGVVCVDHLLRTVAPSPTDAMVTRIAAVKRPGKRIVFAFEGEPFLALHRRIAGRL